MHGNEAKYKTMYLYFLLIWLLFQPQFLRWAEEGLCIRKPIFFTVLLSQGANYGAEIKHHQLFMRHFILPNWRGVGRADTNFLLINASQKQEERWLTAPVQLWIQSCRCNLCISQPVSGAVPLAVKGDPCQASAGWEVPVMPRAADCLTWMLNGGERLFHLIALCYSL